MEHTPTALQASLMKQKAESLIESHKELKRQNHTLRMQLEELRHESLITAAERDLRECVRLQTQHIAELEKCLTQTGESAQEEQPSLRQRGKLLFSQLRFGETAEKTDEPQPPHIMDLDEIQELFLCG